MERAEAELDKSENRKQRRKSRRGWEGRGAEEEPEKSERKMKRQRTEGGD